MELGGNKKAADFFLAHGWVGGRNFHNEKYSSQAAVLYKAYLQELVSKHMPGQSHSRFFFCFFLLN
jgi:hypothetical protein